MIQSLSQGRARRAILPIIVWLAFAWRAWGLTSQSLWRDEVDVIRFATRPWPEMLAVFRRPGENGPLFYLLLRPWLAVAGQSEYALRYAALWAGVIAVPLAVILARRLGASRPASLAVGLFMATNPYLTWYSQDGKMYAPITTLALASSLTFVLALQKGHLWRWGLYWLITTICFYIHVMAVLLIPLHALWFLVAWPRERRRWWGYGLALAGLVLPYLPLVKWQYRLLTARWFHPGFPFIPLDQMFVVLLLALVRGFYPVSSAWSLMPAVFLTLAGLWMGECRPTGAWIGHRRGSVLWLGLWFTFPVFALFAISLRVPLFTDRYLIWITPAFWILAGLGVSAVASYSRWIALAVFGCAIAFNLQATGYQTQVPIKSDFRQAAAWVEAQRQPDDVIMPIMPYIRHTYAYYAGDDVPIVEPPYTNAGATPEEVDEAMRRLLSGRAGVWLVASEEEAWDRRKLVRAWLEDHGQLVTQRQFTRVEVLYYRLKLPTGMGDKP